jgi:hypothetical protein
MLIVSGLEHEASGRAALPSARSMRQAKRAPSSAVNAQVGVVSAVSAPGASVMTGRSGVTRSRS